MINVLFSNWNDKSICIFTNPPQIDKRLLFFYLKIWKYGKTAHKKKEHCQCSYIYICVSFFTKRKKEEEFANIEHETEIIQHYAICISHWFIFIAK